MGDIFDKLDKLKPGEGLIPTQEELEQFYEETRPTDGWEPEGEDFFDGRVYLCPDQR